MSKIFYDTRGPENLRHNLYSITDKCIYSDRILVFNTLIIQ